MYKLRQRFGASTMLMKLIYINIAVFLVLRIIGIGYFVAGSGDMEFLRYVEVPSLPAVLLARPWTIITYMFAQYDFLHILFNMLWLYWFGVIFVEFFSAKQLCGLYVIGGIAGAMLYILAYNLLPPFSGQASSLIGSSAAVIAIVIGISLYAPDYKLNLLFIGAVSLKWIAIVTIGIDLLSIDSANAGGHIAHLGGALVGILFALSIKRGRDITRPVNMVLNLFATMLDRKPRFDRPVTGRRAYHYAPQAKPGGKTAMSSEDEAILDKILDKIKQSGYTSLTEDEKKRLFEVSRKGDK